MFNNIKERLQDRTEKNAIKSELSYDKVKKVNGKIISSKRITETVYLKRSRLPLIGDWGRIYPVINEDGSWNFINLVFGGKRNLIKLLIVMGLVALIFLGYQELFSQNEYLRSMCGPVLQIRY